MKPEEYLALQTQRHGFRAAPGGTPEDLYRDARIAAQRERDRRAAARVLRPWHLPFPKRDPKPAKPPAASRVILLPAASVAVAALIATLLMLPARTAVPVARPATGTD